MEKPNITEGPWESNGEGTIYRWGNGPETKGYRPCIAKVSIWKDSKAEGSANANAIEQVPDLIDSLMVAVGWMQWWLDEHECDCGMHHNCGRTEREHELSIMKDTLKNAGVGFESN